MNCLYQVVTNRCICCLGLLLLFAGFSLAICGQTCGQTAAEKIELAQANAYAREGFKLYGERKYASAVKLTEQVLEIRQRILGTEHSHCVISLGNLADLHRAMGSFELSEPLYLEAKRTQKKVFGIEHPEYAATLDKLATLYKDMGSYKRAEPLYIEAKKIREKVRGKTHPEYGVTLNNLAGLYQKMGKFERAEPLYIESKQIALKVLGKESRGYATNLTNLAGLYKEMGAYGRAEEMYLEGIEIRRKMFGEEHLHYANSLHNLALFYSSMGAYERAEPLSLASKRIVENVLGKRHPVYAAILKNLGSLNSSLGVYERAEAFYLEAAQVEESVLGKEHPKYGITLQNLASLYLTIGSYERSETLYLEAMQIQEKALGKEHSNYASTLRNLASLYRCMDLYERSEALHLEAIKIQEKVLGREHPEHAETLKNLADLYKAKGDYDRAKPLYFDGMRVQEKTLGKEHPDYAGTVNGLANLFASQKEYPESALWRARARKSTAGHIGRILLSLSASEQQLFLKENFSTELKADLSFAFQFHGSVDRLDQVSAEWLANGKGVAHRALSQRNLWLRDVKDPSKSKEVTQLLSIRNQLAKLAMTVAAPNKAAARQAQIAQLSKKERTLASQLGADFQTSNQWIEFEQLRTAIPASGVLVDIGRFRDYNYEATGKKSPWGTSRYAAWLTFADKEFVKIIDLGPAKDIDKQISQVRAKLQSPQEILESEGEAAAAEQIRSDLKGLADKIWQPIANELGDETTNIVLSPDGMLWLVPWTALPAGDADGTDRFLIEKHNLRLVTSARDLLAKPDQRRSNPPVVFANPSFDQSSDQKRDSIKRIFRKLPTASDTTHSISAQSLLGKVSSLPNTGIEADAIKPRLQAYTSSEPIVYKQRWALEHVVKKLKNPRIATFATHGFFLPEQEVDFDEDRRTSDSSRSIALDKNQKPVENSLLRCGLLLAGCNDRNSVVGDDDGILTGMEITGIDFRGTELVVLSACDTGIGDVRNGEGVAGLRQAFQLAGVDSVLASLWQVDDAETARLMTLFFDNLAKGMTKSESLRQAQLSRIKARRARYGAAHPFFWAAFTLTGQD